MNLLYASIAPTSLHSNLLSYWWQLKSAATSLRGYFPPLLAAYSAKAATSIYLEKELN
jgi:hypothetical protein